MPARPGGHAAGYFKLVDAANGRSPNMVPSASVTAAWKITPCELKPARFSRTRCLGSNGTSKLLTFHCPPSDAARNGRVDWGKPGTSGPFQSQRSSERRYMEYSRSGSSRFARRKGNYPDRGSSSLHGRKDRSGPRGWFAINTRQDVCAAVVCKTLASIISRIGWESTLAASGPC
jgi:hypothetical protein